jgi:DNA-binding NarL/FixJ family response regulator
MGEAIQTGLSRASRDQARCLAEAAYHSAAVAGDIRRAEVLLAEAWNAAGDLAVPAEIAVAASFIALAEDGDVTAAHRLLLRALESEQAAEPGTQPAENALRTYLLVCHFAGRSDLWESLGRYLASTGACLPPGLRLSALVADPARSPRVLLGRLDAEIESITHLTGPGEIVRIAGTSAFVDRLPGCRTALRRVTRHELTGGAVTLAIHASTLLALEAYQTGQWDEAQRLAQDAAELCETRGYQLLRASARAVLAFLAAARGEAGPARAMADEMIRWAEPRGVRRVQADARYACVLAAQAQCDFEAAYHHATRISPAGQLAPHQPHALWVALDLVEAALRTDRGCEAAAHVRALTEAGAAALSPRLALLSGAAAALVAPDEVAPDLFDQALATADAERWPFDLARVHLLCGERLRRVRQMTRARDHLGLALDAFRRLGAATWVNRATQELRATGQVRPRGDRHDREALTPQELEIAMLAAAGLSNKQIGQRLFLSHRTVGAHLYRIFPKLGIASRAALRDALAHQSAG